METSKRSRDVRPQNESPFLQKISDMIDILNKWHTDQKFINNDYLTFLLIFLKLRDIHYFFSKSILFTFFRFHFFEVPSVEYTY